MVKEQNLRYFGEKNDEKTSMTKNHSKKLPKNVNQVVDFSKPFPKAYSKKSYEKRWMNLKKGFAETPDTGFGEKQGGKTIKNPLLNYLLSLSFISHA